MQIQVLRVTGMPCNVALWVKDMTERLIIYVDASLITDTGVRVLKALLDANIDNWQQSPNRLRSLLHVHTG